MSFFNTSPQSIANPGVRRRPDAALWLCLLLCLPLLARAQSSISYMEAEVAPEQFQYCGDITDAVLLTSILTDPEIPQVGDMVMFRLRKISYPMDSETMQLRDIAYGPSTTAPPTLARTESQVQFTSDPTMPRSFRNGGTQVFDVYFTPREAGLYRFTFISQFWDGGSCSVDIPVAQGACLITSIEGIDPSGSTVEGELDFGIVPVGEDVTATLALTFSQAITVGEPFGFSPDPTPIFQFGDTINLLSNGTEATWDVTFSPDSAQPFAETVEVRAGRDSERPECIVDVDLLGVGAVAELTLSYGEPICGDTLQVPVVLRNESEVLVSDLTARATPGFSLSPDPPGSFSALDFSIGPLGSTDPPDERRFLLRYPLAGSAPSNPTVTVRQVDVLLLEEPIPDAGCIQIVEPENLTLNFGDVVVNTLPPMQSIVLANRGTVAASVAASLQNPGQGFTIAPDGTTAANLTIPPFSETTMGVIFQPSSVGSKTSSIAFASGGDPNIPDVELVGNGIEEPSVMLTFEAGGTVVNPNTTILFPATQLGQQGSMPFVIRNAGNLAATGVQVSAVNGEFTASNPAPVDLEPGQSVNYNLTFQPSAAGTRTGQLNVTGNNLDGGITFGLQGEGTLGDITVEGIGLGVTVTPAQMPYPAVGVMLQETTAQQTILGDLMMDFLPNLPQTPEGFLNAYQAVRFVAGNGETGRTMSFEIAQGDSAAIFPAEQQAEADAAMARFQSGTVAGIIRFSLANLRTPDGAAVTAVNPVLGEVTVEPSAPSIVSLATPQTGTGIDIEVSAVSTTREITGVCLQLNPAAGATLNFTRPDATFLNDRFLEWFNQDDRSFAPGGGFSLVIPVDIDEMRAFGSAEIWLRNGQGWSSANSPCP